MKIVGIFASMFFSVLGASVGLAQALDVDWKFYGGATFDAISHYCFYDANGVVKQSDTHIRVWTKCLPQNDVDNVDIKKDYGGKILETVAQKTAHFYLPPITTAEKLDGDQIMGITTFEQIANISNLQPSSRILYEIDCSQMRLRELSMEFQVKGKTGFSKKGRDWSFIPPETNAATLSKILCLVR